MIGRQTILYGPWLEPQSQPQVAVGDLHVWRLPLPGSQEQRRGWSATLSPDETERAERFVFPADRDAFIAARGQMRCVLAAYLNEQPQTLRFSYGSYGKPALTGCSGVEPLTFNLSHSGDWALLAVSRLHAVGVDVERIREGVEYASVAGELFCPEERRHLERLGGDEHTIAFFQYWTHKECVLKALGTGFSLPASTCQVDVQRGAVYVNSAEVQVYERQWRVYSTTPTDGYAAAVAIAAKPACISLWSCAIPGPPGPT